MEIVANHLRNIVNSTSSDSFHNSLKIKISRLALSELNSKNQNELGWKKATVNRNNKKAYNILFEDNIEKGWVVYQRSFWNGIHDLTVWVAVSDKGEVRSVFSHGMVNKIRGDRK